MGNQLTRLESASGHVSLKGPAITLNTLHDRFVKNGSGAYRALGDPSELSMLKLQLEAVDHPPRCRLPHSSTEFTYVTGTGPNQHAASAQNDGPPCRPLNDLTRHD